MKLFPNLKKEIFLIFIIGVVATFFYKSILLGFIPFPGDLLIAHQEPYRSYSFLGFDPGGVPHKAQGPDVIKQLLPWKHFSIETLKRGELPLWNPYNFSGNPLIANFQSGVFYPLNLLFFIFDFATSWTFFIILSSLLSAVFSYLFLKRIVKSNEAALFGSVSYAFCLYMVVWLEYGNIVHTLAWLPLALYFADKLLDKVGCKVFAGIVITLTFCLLAGYIQGAFYTYAAVFFYFLYKGFAAKRLDKARIVIFLSGLILPVLIASFQILPTLELFVHSTRGNYTAEQIRALLNPFWYLITVFAPDFFGNPASRNYWFDGTYIERVSYFGLIPLLFAIFAISRNIKKMEVKIFAIIFAASLILATDFFINRFFYWIPLPVITTTVPTRILSLFAFSGSALAAIGFENMILRKNLRSLLWISITTLLLLILVSGFTFFYPWFFDASALSENLKISFKNLLLPLVSVFVVSLLIYFYHLQKVLSIKVKRSAVVIVIILITCFDLYFYFNKITPFAPRDFMYPSTPPISFLQEQSGYDRFWTYGGADHESNIGMFDKIYSPEGNDPLHISEYAEIVEASINGTVPKSLPRPTVDIAPGFGKIDITSNPYRERVLNLTSTKYILNKDASINGDYNPDTVTFPVDKFELVWQEGIWQVYQNKNALPRVFIATDYKVIEDRDKAIKAVLSTDTDINRTVILEKEPALTRSEEESGDAKIISYSPNEVVIEADSQGGGLVYLSDTYFPGWGATVDGRDQEVLRANYAFRAVSIPPGRHEIRMQYLPKSFSRSLYIAGASFMIFLAITYYLRTKYEK